MPPKKNWGEESSDDESSSGSEVPQFTAGVPRRKFDDEEGEDSDVLDSWDAAEDSEVEREKAKKAAEAKAKAEAEAKAAKKSRLERIALRQKEHKAAQEAAEAYSDDSDETEQQKRDRLRRAQKEADLKHAEDLFGDVGTGGAGGAATGRKSNAALAAAVITDPFNPNNKIDLGALPLFNPKTRTQLEHLGKTIAPLLQQHTKMPHYTAFFQDLCKTMAKDMPSDQVKKVASSLTAVSNEKMKQEKAGDKTGKKKSKAKTSVVTTSNNINEDAQVYNEGDAFGDNDFM
ncbi:hypothetical protein MKZ38_008604 [Zalerion maritima]|uniref:Eukaryotic translation initiation factor 3 subunit J n=1 Tax=Zalerion maritima TaxID=339359 RepID=A0AAD5RYF9_9PEZI|nr:hypothetical protein MKZ38_008604 [Zalerion maritima]